ncbi:unnamed protein product [Dracunculus medinensis]|uniref:DUF998 domain-containing protein n=1 Tax=Dracunculus medinensis TaxID=318479 RepID=A0A0N4UBS3_DRAME|nr:unnamed protein product [Dracunculus medinensis]
MHKFFNFNNHQAKKQKQLIEEDEKFSFASTYWTKQLKQANSLLFPVTINMVLTLFLWIGIYDGNSDSISHYMLNAAINRTTGNEIIDGLVNGIGYLAIIAVISFTLLFMALHNFTRFVHFWLYASCIAILFGIFAIFLNDVFKKLNWNGTQTYFIIFPLVMLYGITGLFAFFTRNVPLFIHQFYVICNCSLVSLFYLRTFPIYTTWFVLIYIIVWGEFIQKKELFKNFQ